MILCFYWNALFYGLINPQLVVSWWNLVAPEMANLDHYYDFIHRKCSFKEISTHQTYTFKLLIQPPSEKIWWCWLFNRIKIKNVLLLKSQSRCFIPRSGPGLDYGQCLLCLAQWIFQKHNEMKNYKLGIKRSLTFLGLHLDFSLDNSSNLSRVYNF